MVQYVDLEHVAGGRKAFGDPAVLGRRRRIAPRVIVHEDDCSCGRTEDETEHLARMGRDQVEDRNRHPNLPLETILRVDYADMEFLYNKRYNEVCEIGSIRCVTPPHFHSGEALVRGRVPIS